MKKPIEIYISEEEYQILVQEISDLMEVDDNKHNSQLLDLLSNICEKYETTYHIIVEDQPSIIKEVKKFLKTIRGIYNGRRGF